MVQEVHIGLTIHLENHTILPMDAKKPQETQDFYYKVDPNYKIISANSILTTITPDGQIKIDFCVESLVIPDKLTFLAGGDSVTLATPIESDPKYRMQRYVQGGVLLTVGQAEIIAGLMQQLTKQIRDSDRK